MTDYWWTHWQWAGDATHPGFAPIEHALEVDEPIIGYKATAWRLVTTDYPPDPSIQDPPGDAALVYHLAYVTHAGPHLDALPGERAALEAKVGPLHVTAEEPSGMDQEDRALYRSLAKRQALHFLTQQAGPLIDSVLGR